LNIQAGLRPAWIFNFSKYKKTMSNGQTTLIAVLGDQPQVVTLTLDLLLAQGEAIDRVLAVYPAGNLRCRTSFRTLAREFSGNRYGGRTMTLRAAHIRMGTRDLTVIRNSQETEAARRTFIDLFSNLKSRGERILLSIEGGQRILALLAVCTAMLHFTTEDRIWLLHASEDLLAVEGTTLHAPAGADVHLIEAPIVPWAAYLPGLAPLLGNTRDEVRARGWQDDGERARCRQVWERLTPRQKDTLRELAVGRGTRQAAGRLGIAASTVVSHKTAIFHACRRAWMEEELRIDTVFLRERFRGFLGGV
jgi:CRISPR-associated protein Csx14